MHEIVTRGRARPLHDHGEMRPRVWSFAASAVVIAHTGCVHEDESLPKGPPPTVLEVPTLSGGTEPVWMYIATPAGPGPYPVVVYGHGQGTDDIVNCTPDRAPDNGDAVTGEHIADALADQGYLAISIFYRNQGAMVPAIGELRGRDHYILDARAFLAAAHFAHDELDGDSRVSLIGVSMGSFPATWAVAPLPELADLQDGLDIVTTIPTAMLGNQIGNTGRNKGLLASSDLSQRRASIALAGLASVGPRTALALDPSLTAEDLRGAAGAGLTDAGSELVQRVFLDAPDASLDGCTNIAVPAACSPTCITSTFDAVGAAHSLTDVDPEDWLTQDTLDAIGYWNPPTAIDPGPDTTNAMLAAQRALSPAYVLAGSLKTKRLLPLASVGDHVVVDQLAGSSAPGDLYLDRLRGTGVTMPDPIPIVEDSSCDHGDYLDASRPQCGWAIVLHELTTAFAN